MASLGELLPLLPVGLLLAGGMVLLLTEASLSGERRGYQATLACLFGVGAALAAAPGLSGPGRSLFSGAMTADPFGAFITLTVSIGLVLTNLTAAGFLRERESERGEFYALALFAAAGMALLASATELLMLFISLEVMSVAIYALAAYLRKGLRPSEAALKYFLLGAFSSALFLYGSALIYGATGSTRLTAIDFKALGPSPLLLGGLALVAAGFAFKIAAVPFHMWAPDVYEGAPTPVTAFMAVGVKAAAFASFLRVLLVAFGRPIPGADSALWMPLLGTLAVVTMVVGNLLALPQRNVKRMLAYSSVAHAGYLLVGVTAAGLPGLRPTATEGILFYLFSYMAAAVGAFACLAAVEKRESEGAVAWDLDRFAGLGRRRPVLALAAGAFMVSLAGIPPTAGFMAKLLIFKSAIDAQQYTLAVIGVLASAAGAYYYLRVVVYMYMRAPEEAVVLPQQRWQIDAAALLCLLLVVGFGVLPSPLATLARASGLTP